jgi:ribonuclease HI
MVRTSELELFNKTLKFCFPMASSQNINFKQINLHHCKEATSILRCSLDSGQTGVSLIQEPYFFKGGVRGLGNSGSIHCVVSQGEIVRACVYTHKSLNAMLLRQFSSSDFVAVQIRYSRKGVDHKLVVCSAYLAYDKLVPSKELTNLVEYCDQNNIQVIIGCDANSHHVVWGSSDTNKRGEKLLEFILAADLSVLNRGNRPTFVTRNREEVIDITICSAAVELDVSGWNVSQEYSMSDHQTIQFSLTADDFSTKPFRNPKKTNWSVFKETLVCLMDGWKAPVESTFKIEEAVRFLTSRIILSYEESCPLIKPRDMRESFWKNADLRKLQRTYRKAWNHRHRDFDAFKQSRKAFKKEYRKLKRRSWRDFCESIKGCSASAKIHRILSKDRDQLVGSLKLPNGEYTRDENSLLSHLLETHFPGCNEIDYSDEYEDEILLSAISESTIKKAGHIASPQNVRWAINSFSPFKSPGMDGIFPALLQNGLDSIVEHLSNIFTSCLALGYIPRKWREVRVTFIPKPGRGDYEQAKNHRGISLSSFLLKTLERLTDFHIRRNVLTINPLHSNQHAYQRGRSTMSAIYKLTSLIESTLDIKQVALAVFLDIEGAFDRATFESFTTAARNKGIDEFLIEWILSMLKKRILTADLKGIKVQRRPVMGCPQGGVLSPLIWLLIADAFLYQLDVENIHSVGFADDFVLLVRGSFVDVVSDRMQQALRTVENFTSSVSLSVNPSKVGAMLFTRRRNCQVKPLRLFGENISLVSEFKFLGLTLDCKLNWGRHLEARILKACRTFGQCRRAVGRVWGLSPEVLHWLYTSVVRPVLSYGSVAWWQKAQKPTVIKSLNHLQRLGLLAMTGAMSTTPTAALECICGLLPLQTHLEAEAQSELFRLKNWGQFNPNNVSSNSYKRLWDKMVKFNSLLNAPNDCMISQIITNRKFSVLFPTREDWVENSQWLAADNNFFTDGSLCEDLAGSGVFSDNPEIQLALSLGPNVSVFQAEALAIAECALYCLKEGFSGRRIHICSDSKAALLAISSCRFDSRLTLECRELIQRLAESNSVNLLWVPGHSGVNGNENADKLAREGSSEIPVAPIPVIPLSKSWFKSNLTKWCSITHSFLWKRVQTCKQAKQIIVEPLCNSETKRLRSLKKSELRCLVGVLTGHFYFNKHLNNMGLAPNPICERCGEYEDTAFHLICLRPRVAQRRFKIFGDFYLSQRKYKDLSIWKIKDFIALISLKTHL